MGEEVELLVGLHNNGDNEFNVTFLTVEMVVPQDYFYVVQNVGACRAGGVLLALTWRAMCSSRTASTASRCSLERSTPLRTPSRRTRASTRATLASRCSSTTTTWRATCGAARSTTTPSGARMRTPCRVRVLNRTAAQPCGAFRLCGRDHILQVRPRRLRGLPRCVPHLPSDEQEEQEG